MMPRDESLFSSVFSGQILYPGCDNGIVSLFVWLLEKLFDDSAGLFWNWFCHDDFDLESNSLGWRLKLGEQGLFAFAVVHC